MRLIDISFSIFKIKSKLLIFYHMILSTYCVYTKTYYSQLKCPSKVCCGRIQEYQVSETYSRTQDMIHAGDIQTPRIKEPLYILLLSTIYMFILILMIHSFSPYAHQFQHKSRILTSILNVIGRMYFGFQVYLMIEHVSKKVELHGLLLFSRDPLLFK